jgi:hypothetical protein
MTNGCLYHPQTQGSVENANRTFKQRLTALQLETRRSALQWISLLPQLAILINTRPNYALPRGKTPYDVWFARRPHWIFEEHEHASAQRNGEGSLTQASDDEEAFFVDDEVDSEAEDMVLTRIEAEVAKNNARLQERMKKGNKKAVVLPEQSIATLKIPSKNRLKTEPPRLAVQVLEYKHGQYKLQSK